MLSGTPCTSNTMCEQSEIACLSTGQIYFFICISAVIAYKVLLSQQMSDWFLSHASYFVCYCCGMCDVSWVNRTAYILVGAMLVKIPCLTYCQDWESGTVAFMRTMAVCKCCVFDMPTQCQKTMGITITCLWLPVLLCLLGKAFDAIRKGSIWNCLATTYNMLYVTGSVFWN